MHPGLLGSPDHTEVEAADLVRTETGFSFSWSRCNPAASGFGRTDELTRQTTEVSLPFAWRLLIESAATATAVFVICQPVSGELARFWMFVAGRDIDEERATQLAQLHRTITEQDRVVVESQRPRLLPIDITEELHLKGPDAPSLEYRRRLAALTGPE